MSSNPETPSRRLGYELQDANPRGLFIFFVCMGCFLVVMGLLVAWLFGYFAKYEIPKPVISQPFVNVQPVPPSPLLQASPEVDIQNYRQSQQNILNSYGWIDRQQGVVRIPIDRAMDLLSQKGFPTRPQQGAALTAGRAGKGSASTSSQNAADHSEVQP